MDRSLTDMSVDLTTRRWQKAIVRDAEQKLGRPLKAHERGFITSRTGYVALEVIHDTVKSAQPSVLEPYLASERAAQQEPR